jgi:hypothetical protein
MALWAVCALSFWRLRAMEYGWDVLIGGLFFLLVPAAIVASVIAWA